jgi:hypothetical protein
VKFERLACLPFEAVRGLGQLVLWATEKAVPPAPEYRRQPASITYYQTPEAKK